MEELWNSEQRAKSRRSRALSLAHNHADTAHAPTRGCADTALHALDAGSRPEPPWAHSGAHAHIPAPVLTHVPRPPIRQEAKEGEYAHDSEASWSSSVKFENVRSKKLTRVTIETHDKHDLLLELCSALSSLGLSVASAQCTISEGGTVAAGFEVRSEKGSMVPQEEWNLVRTRLLASCRKRGGKDWRHKDRRLKEIFNAIGHNQPGFLSSGKVDQDMVNQYARTLRLPTAFVADFVQVRRARARLSLVVGFGRPNPHREDSAGELCWTSSKTDELWRWL